MKKLLLLLLVPVLLCTRCDLKKTPRDDGSQLAVSPAKGSPGETVLIAKPQGKFGSSTKGLQVTFGKTPATVIGTDPQGNLRVLVPMGAEGGTSVSVSENGQSAGKAAFEMLPPTGRQLVLQMDPSGKLEMLSSKPYGGGHDSGFSTRTFQLSYDLLSADGNLLFSASISHPVKERMEVFERPDGAQIHREAKVSPSVFPVKIPNLRQAVLIRFYEAERGMDLTTEAGRRERKFLQEIKL